MEDEVELSIQYQQCGHTAIEKHCLRTVGIVMQKNQRNKKESSENRPCKRDLQSQTP